MEITHLFAVLAVTDFGRGCEWYERLFGRPPDRLPREGEAIWQLSPEASLYLLADPTRAGSGFLTVAVSDLDAHVGTLGARGVPVGEHPAGAGMLRRVSVDDPDGNTITFFETRGAEDASPADFHLLVKQRELERDAAAMVGTLAEDFAAVHEHGVAERLRDHASDWRSLRGQVQELRVTLRVLGPRLERPQADAIAGHLDTLDVLLRRLQNLGRGERWVEG